MYRSYDEMPKIGLPNAGEIKISDSTLRDGAQMTGVVLTRKHKLKIYEYLHDIGIEKLECFLFNERDKKVAKDMLKLGYDKPEVTGWARANPKDIDLILEMDGIKETGILMSISDTHIYDKLGLKSRDKATEKYLNALEYAKDHGLKVRCHMEDITRADFSFVSEFTKKIIEIAPDTIIRLCDTLGLGLPYENSPLPYSIPKMIEVMKEAGVRDIETHMHDDFGLAIANSLAGYIHGANWSNVTFLGIGERAGNAELEKILLFLIWRVEGFERYNAEKLVEFARYMEKETRFFVPRNKAVVGRNIFAHESGIHTAGVIKNPFTYEPFPPKLVGGERRLVVGDTSGAEVIRNKVEEIVEALIDVKVKVDKRDPRIIKIHNKIHKLYDKEGRRSSISDDEMKKYVEKYFLFEPVADVLAANENNGES
ncbi:MAG: isopropylmalate synthase [Candidatus Altiarchaeales archaeon ex4484_96]|nr:MAG: isopropylmalate synthase [Candidatus Altiarchaeales archaeon ex4484_96]